MGVAAAGHHESFDAAALTDDETSVRCEGWPAFPDPFFLRPAGGWKQPPETFREIVQDRPVRRNLRRSAAERISTRISVKRSWFPAAQKQSAVAHSSVKSQLWNAEAGQVGREAVHRHGDKILVTHRHDG